MISVYLLSTLSLYCLRSLAQDDTCYWRSRDAISPEAAPGWFACSNTQQKPGGAQLCCLAGSQCSDDALCRQASSSGGYNYFVGGCTDPNYNDPVCRQSCTSDAQTWITWDSTSNVWECCGDNGLSSCDTPTGETFTAQAPLQFSAVASSQTETFSTSATPTSSMSSTSAATTTSSSSSTASSSASGSSGSNSNSSNSDTGLSTGTKAGIGVGVAAGALAVIGGIIFFCWRKRRSTNVQEHRQEPVSENTWQQGHYHDQHQSMPPQYPSHQGYEIYAKRAPDSAQSSPQQVPPQEMPAQGLHSDTHELSSGRGSQRMSVRK